LTVVEKEWPDLGERRWPDVMSSELINGKITHDIDLGDGDEYILSIFVRGTEVPLAAYSGTISLICRYVKTKKSKDEPAMDLLHRELTEVVRGEKIKGFTLSPVKKKTTKTIAVGWNESISSLKNRIKEEFNVDVKFRQ
jgi:hypothetical protein